MGGGPYLCGRLKRNQRAGQACLRAVEEEPHAQRLGALYGNQTHLPAQVIRAFKQRGAGLVRVGVAFQALNTFLNHVLETWADVEVFLDCELCAIGQHDVYLGTA
jgi:hypothetical protein